MSFTARLTSLILQQYKIGFKVALKKINVIVVPNGVTSTNERLFLVFRNANNASNKYGKKQNNIANCSHRALHTVFRYRIISARGC